MLNIMRDMDRRRDHEAALQKEAQAISGTLSSDKTLFVSTWADYDRDDVVTLWVATCLSVGINPKHKAVYSEEFAKKVVAIGSATDDFIKELNEVIRRYKNVSTHSKNPNSNLNTADELRKTIELSVFRKWVVMEKDWELPKGFPGAPAPVESPDQPNVTTPSPTPEPTAPPMVDKSASCDVETGKAGPIPINTYKSEEEKPWLIANPKDPAPEQSWYTPARYFARQFLREDSTLLRKRNVLAEKVSKTLANTGFKKRGGKLPLSSGTVLKAFSNLHWG